MFSQGIDGRCLHALSFFFFPLVKQLWTYQGKKSKFWVMFGLLSSELCKIMGEMTGTVESKSFIYAFWTESLDSFWERKLFFIFILSMSEQI